MEAVEGDWLDNERVKQWQLTPLEKKLIESTKITYMIGKNSNLVPVIFPSDVIQALQILSCNVARSKAHVLKENPYLFPSTRFSEFHLSGWHGFDEICKGVELEKRENITFTKNRHLVSTIYSMMELPKDQHEDFYNHMGHSEQMSKARYSFITVF